ncbi:MAG TPA: Xaa-Pro peptidase family protein [Candidatus Krumholzibacteria bacterium]|nr:Xaa-Pro peptidase family protein [Candidatus Krumholzibacteria bacterium]
MPRPASKHILLYAASEADADVLYATGFFCPDPFLFIRTPAGRRIYVMSDLEIDRARAQSNAHRVLAMSRYTEMARRRMGKTPAAGDIIAEVLRDLNIRSVVVPSSFSAGIADRLRSHRIRVDAAQKALFPERLHKRADEVAHVVRAMRATEAGMQRAIDLLGRAQVRKGWLVSGGRRLTAEDVRRAANLEIFSRGYIPAHTIVAPGKHGCDPHDVGSGPIRAGEPVILDIFPRSESTGYFADITRTVVRGKASPRVRAMYAAVLAAQRGALRSIRHGARGRDIHGAILKLFESRGFKTGKMDGRMQGFFHGTGHGLGLEIHEPPRIAMSDDVLEAGMVVTVEPGLYYAGVGGVRIEDTVLVTRTGIRNLTRFPKFLEIP